MSDGPRRIALTGTPGTGKTTAARLLAAGDRSPAPAEGDDHPPVEIPDADARAAGAVPVVHLNRAIESAGLHGGEDPDRGSVYADLDAVADWLDEHAPTGGAGSVEGDGPEDDAGGSAEGPVDAYVVESHLAHHLSADAVVVLRCSPAVLEDRLVDRGESPASARENAESEALDVVLAEAVERHGTDAVYEVDATDLSPTAVADAVRAIVAGEREPSAGTVDFTAYLE